MDGLIIECPCCGNKLNVSFNGNGKPVVSLVNKKKLSQDELSRKFNIELGIVGEVNDDEC